MSDHTPQSYAHEGERYWNEEGGRTWIAHIDQIEILNAPLSTISLERAMPKEGEVVLDVGCGGGATSRHMAERIGSAIDIDHGQLATLVKTYVKHLDKESYFELF